MKMKKSHLSLSACALLAVFAFSGCGSSSSSDDSSTSTGTLELNPLLANIDYTCGSHSGTTNTSGEYIYSSGDTCSFVIGGVTLTGAGGSNLTIEQLASNNEGVSSEALAAYIIAKMSEKTGITYDVNNLPDVFELPDDIEGDTSNPLSFDSIDTLLASIDDASLVQKINKIKYEVSNRFAKRVSLAFEEIDVPTTNEDKLTQQASSKAYVNNEEQSIEYKTIMRTGYSDNNEILGQSKDYQDNPITFGDGSPYICNGTNGGAGSGMDFTSLHNVDGKLYIISQYECGLGSFYMLEVNQDEATGELSPKSGTLQFISQKAEFGGWVHCAGQKTPWNSHLSSEEYEADAKTSSNYYLSEMAKFWGNDSSKANAYYYGWTPEIKIENGSPVYYKHYSMGRFSHELSYVMPDKKTVYMSDDGTNVGFLMYVADKQEDLSAGTLYAAKWNQTSENGVGVGEADLAWISLGHATDSEIREILDPDGDITTNDAPSFTDIFDTVEPSSGTCASGYTLVNTNGIGEECLKLKEGMQLAASRLETRRYAAMLGATTEFRKEEGMSFDKNSGTFYVAMSEVRKGMTDNTDSNDSSSINHIRVEENKCGAVYALDISTETMSDTQNKEINSSYVLKNMYGIVEGTYLEGTDLAYAEDSIYYGNRCDVNGIASPDNLSFLENSSTLVIGEDTSHHENNVVWAYDTKTKELTRIFTTPLGAETTSPFWYPELKNGYGYLGVVTQHPSTESTDGGESAFGYVGPFENLTDLQDTADSLGSIEKIATYTTSTEGGAEIVAFDKENNKAYTTNGAANAIDILNVTYNSQTKETTMTKANSIDLSSYGASVQSVAVSNGKVAVAVGSSDKATIKGSVVVFDTAGNHIKTVEAGYLPDMVTFNEDGTIILVANEGEPNSDYSVDPVGSVGIIDVANDYAYTDLTFDSVTIPDEVIIKDGSQKAADIEPEYITVSGDKAYVTLQENNALGIIDIANKEILSVVSLGFKDHSLEKNAIDIEEEGQALLKAYDSLYGMYMPDSIASYKIGTQTYLVTANEGDGREYGEEGTDTYYTNEAKIKNLDLADSLVSVYADENDLKVHTELGKNDQGKYEKLYAFGARSFSIWKDDGSLVFDSANELSKLTAKFMPELFNQDDGEMDGRSGNKGVEPEALAVGEIKDRTYAFVGLERQNAIVVFDISAAEDAKFIKYIITQEDGDISLEGMKFVSREDSPTGNALLFVSYEMSGSTSVYEIK
jgi:hypothetical protein